MKMRSPSFRRHRPDTSGARCRTGFSIIEVIVVIVILGVVGAIIGPRLSSLGGRQTRADAQGIAEILSIAARRDELTSQPVALEFQAERGSIRMLVFSPQSGDDGRPQWHVDRMAPAAELRDSVISSVQSDGTELDVRRWRVEFAQNSRRPDLHIVIKDERHGDTWRIELPAGSTRALVVAGDAPVGAGDGSIDLDLAGKSEESW
jgi:prepilin-type N-terminal cleavage/methylation domain-containing protein